MAVLVAVVTHHEDGVLPDACLLIINIVVYLVHDNLCIAIRTCRDASYGDVRLFCQQAGTLVVVQQPKVVVAHIATRVTV